jgi:hypothetical protein
MPSKSRRKNKRTAEEALNEEQKDNAEVDGQDEIELDEKPVLKKRVDLNFKLLSKHGQ